MPWPSTGVAAHRSAARAHPTERCMLPGMPSSFADPGDSQMPLPSAARWPAIAGAAATVMLSAAILLGAVPEASPAEAAAPLPVTEVAPGLYAHTGAVALMTRQN